MEKVSAILRLKGPHFKFISSDSTIDEVLCRMMCENTDHLVVINKDERFIGVITEHDIICKAMQGDFYPAVTKVEQLVNKSLPTASTDDTVHQCLHRMQQYHVKFLPVFEGFVFKGILCADDILNEAAIHENMIFDEDRTKLIY